MRCAGRPWGRWAASVTPGTDTGRGGGEHKEFENPTPTINLRTTSKKTVHDLTLATRRNHHHAPQSTKENP
jgi:hypothetical protein